MEYDNIVKKDMPKRVPPTRSILDQIYLILWSFETKEHTKMTLIKSEEENRQFQERLDRSFSKEGLIPYATLVVNVPKNRG